MPALNTTPPNPTTESATDGASIAGLVSLKDEREVGMRHLNTGAGKVCIAQSHYLNCSFLRGDTRQKPTSA